MSAAYNYLAAVSDFDTERTFFTPRMKAEP